MAKFWNWKNEGEGRILQLYGPIDEDNIWGDSVTPQMFRDELESGEGDVTVWINSPGGSVLAAAEIYNMLCDYKGRIVVKIDAIAASAASVVAMAGDRVLISPVGMILVHDPMTITMGNASDMEKAITTLNEIKESIINAYAKKTGLSRNKIAKLMSDETWLSARKAVELGFADEILFNDNKDTEPEGDVNDAKEIEAVWQPYSIKAMGQKFMDSLIPAGEPVKTSAGPDDGKYDVVEEETDTEQCETCMNTGDSTVDEVLDESDKDPGDSELMEQITTVTDHLIRVSEQIVAVADRFASVIDEFVEALSSEVDDDIDIPILDENDIDDPNTEPSKSVTEPLIGLDGKTEDGSMPYNMLKKQLELLR